MGTSFKGWQTKAHGRAWTRRRQGNTARRGGFVAFAGEDIAPRLGAPRGTPDMMEICRDVLFGLDSHPLTTYPAGMPLVGGSKRIIVTEPSWPPIWSATATPFSFSATSSLAGCGISWAR